MAGVVGLASLVEVFIPFNGGFDCGGPFAVLSFTLGALVLGAVEGPAVVGSVDD